MKKKIISILLILIYFFAVVFPYSSFANSENLELHADSCLLMDKASKKVLYEKNGYEKMSPASTTKVMTAILTLENCSLTDTATVSYYAVHSVPDTYSIVNLVPGEKILIRDLLYSLMVASANDSAFVLAEYIANNGNNYAIDSTEDTKNKFNKSIEIFSDMMNKKALEYGCKNTNFVNPNGIQNDNHYSTAYDLALIAYNAIKDDTITKIVNIKDYSIANSDLYQGEARVFKNTNSLLNPSSPAYYEYANGLKTGYTDAAQYCLIATATKDNSTLIAVVLHSPSGSNHAISREKDCKTLFEYGFNYFKELALIEKNGIVTSLKIFNGTDESKNLNLIAKDGLYALLEKNKVIDISPIITINKHLAPIAKNEVVGTATYTIDDVQYVTDLIAEHDVYPNNYLIFILILIIVFIIALIVLFIIIKTNSKNDHSPYVFK